MTGSHPWPRGPWFTRLALILSIAGLWFFVHIQKTRLPLVQQEDLSAYIRVNLPAIPGWHSYTVIETQKGDLAIPSDLGILDRAEITPDRQRLKAFLESEVYGKPLWRVIQWPLLGFLVLLIGLARAGRVLDRQNNGERLLQGAPIVSRWRWNRPLLFRPSERGLYIETE